MTRNLMLFISDSRSNMKYCLLYAIVERKLLVPMVVLAGFLISMIAIMPMAIADRDDDDDDDDDDREDKKKQLDNQVALMQRTDSVIIPLEGRHAETYHCEKGEIMLGGIVENHSAESISNAIWRIDHQEQTYDVNISNRDPVPLEVNVTYLCASLKS